MSAKPGGHALTFIFITVFLNMMGVGLIIPVTPSLIMEITGDPNVAHAARWGGALLFVFAMAQFFMAPVMGNLSDAYGRRPVLLISLAGYAMDYLLMALAPSLAILFVGRLFSGVFGATFSTAMAAIADVSTKETRAGNFGLVGAAFGLGFIAGPALGGLIGEAFGPRAPFLAASAVTALACVYGWFVLPETLSADKRRPFDIARANPMGSLAQFRANPVVMRIAAAVFLVQSAHWALTATWNYWSIARFNWSEGQIGFSLALVGVMAALVQGGLTRRVVTKFGEARVAVFAICVMVVQYLALAFAPSAGFVFVAIVVCSLAGLAMPALQGLAANHVGDDQQGEIQGALTSVLSLTALFGPIMMTQTFAVFAAEDAEPRFVGAAFLLAAVLTFCALWPLRGTLQRVAAPSNEAARDRVTDDAA